MNLEILVQQAWSLRVKLRQCVETECLGKAARSIFLVRKKRLNHAYETVKVLLHNQRDIIYVSDKHNN